MRKMSKKKTAQEHSLISTFRSITNRFMFSRATLTVRQRFAYVVVSFLLGITYLRILLTVGFELSAGAVLSLLLGGMCFGVCILNLVVIGLDRRQQW
jgi:hypothetical protein